MRDTSVFVGGRGDVKALRNSKISMALGIRGDVESKEAAHMIVMDDGIRSVVHACLKGR